MHELTLAQDIVSQVTDLAKNEQAKKILSVTIAIGPLSGVMRDSLEFCFSEVQKGTMLEGAVLRVEETGLLVYCEDCKEERPVQNFSMTCPLCSGQNVRVSGGDELKLLKMEIE